MDSLLCLVVGTQSLSGPFKVCLTKRQAAADLRAYSNDNPDRQSTCCPTGFRFAHVEYVLWHAINSNKHGVDPCCLLSLPALLHTGSFLTSRLRSGVSLVCDMVCEILFHIAQEQAHDCAHHHPITDVMVGPFARQVHTRMALVGSRSQCSELPWSARGVIKCATRATGDTLSGLRGQQ